MIEFKPEILQFQAVQLIEEGSESFGRELAALAATESPLAKKTRSLAFIKFTLCHSLPAVNENGACWTYATLRNSLSTVEHNLIDINHIVGDNIPIMSGVDPDAQDKIIGHMVSAEIAEVPENDDTLVPNQAIPIVVTGVLYKRAQGVQDLIDRMKNGETVKVSMECEFDEIGFFYDGKLYSQDQNPEIAMAFRNGKRSIAGKALARVLGGVKPEGGIVNFHGAALLVGDQPADPNAEVKAAIASKAMKEIGGEMSVVEAQDDEKAMLNSSAEPTERQNGEVPPLTPLAYDGPAEELTLQKLNEGLEKQAEAISGIEKFLKATLDRWERLTGKSSKAVEETLNNEQVEEPTLDPNDEYADPGYNDQGVPKFPLRNRGEVVEAANHFSHIHNTMGYTPQQLGLIQERILKAAVKFKLSIPSVLVTASVSSEPATTQLPETTQEETTMTVNDPKATAAEDKKCSDCDKPMAECKCEEAKKSKKDDDKKDDKDGDDKPAFFQKKDKGSEDADAEEASRKRVEELARENEALKTQQAELLKAVNEMKAAIELRDKRDRANQRKAALAATIDLDDELATDLESTLMDAEDEEFASFQALVEKIFQRGLKKASATVDAASQPAADAATTGEETTADDKPADTPAQEASAASGSPDASATTEAGTVKAFAPTVQSEVAADAGSKKPNRFRHVF